MKHVKFSRRFFVCGGLSVLSGGCAEIPLVVNAAKAAKMIIAGGSDANISRDLVSQLPYASISAKIGRGPKSLLVLAKSEHDRHHWISADNAIIVTRNGRIVQTAGFPENLKNTRLMGKDPVSRSLHLDAIQRSSRREIDSEIDNRYGIPIISNYKKTTEREISILGIKIKTVLVKEYNEAKTLNWSFVNYYWADKYDGFIWKSRQTIARSFPPIDIEVLKPSV